MIILNAGVPRSGTVLVNAIVRAVLSRERVPLAQANPHGKELPALIRRLKRQGFDQLKHILIHTHNWDGETSRLLAGAANVTGFANFRDPRDVCVSLMKLHDLDFEDMLEATDRYFAAFAEMLDVLDLMVVPYELLVSDKRAMIFQIARRLGVWLPLDQIDAIDDETSLDRHRSVMEKVRAREVDEVVERRNRSRILVEDKRTLINDRHIQSGAQGRWRTELDDAQREVLCTRLKPILEQYGYSD
ncbi:MAG: sulfotransferase domain-containing protein [Pseudomonadota bacterium]